jgi:hypothetical protein
MKEVKIMVEANYLLEMTANEWINSNYDIPSEVKNNFVLLAGYLERYLSDGYAYSTKWERNGDVFIRIFSKSPIDKTHRRVSLYVSFHQRFIEVCYDGLEICNMYISDAKAPVVAFRSVPNTWTDAIGIQNVFNTLFQNIFKKESR